MTDMPLKETIRSAEAESALDRQIEHLLVAVEHELRSASDGMDELNLIKTLQRPPWQLLGQVNFHEPEMLYPVHFVLFHVLYRLRDRLTESGERLDISPLRIKLSREAVVGGTGVPGQHDELRNFYLDLTHYQLSEDSIRQMMDDFWSGRPAARPAHEDIRKAARALGFDVVPSEFAEVKRRFRRAVMQAHPDRGGTTETVQNLNQAFSVLKHHFQALT